MEQEQHNQMELVDHLGELRRRLFWIAGILVISLAGSLFAAGPAIHFLQSIPPANGLLKWHVFSPWDSLRLYMSFAFVTALIVVLPVAMYHIWAFVSPGLRSIEKKAALIYLPFAVILYLIGLAFGFFVVFPMAFHFSQMISENLGLQEVYGAAQYFSFMFNIILPMSILFELPIVVLFLTKLRILNPGLLVKFRRIAYMVLVILAAIVTPPDAISAIVVFVPMVVLYEFSIMLSGVIYRKQQVQDAEWEKEYGEK
jgi:sec-independent protein translocase protein TatC